MVMSVESRDVCKKKFKARVKKIERSVAVQVKSGYKYQSHVTLSAYLRWEVQFSSFA